MVQKTALVLVAWWRVEIRTCVCGLPEKLKYVLMRAPLILPACNSYLNSTFPSLVIHTSKWRFLALRLCACFWWQSKKASFMEAMYYWDHAMGDAGWSSVDWLQLGHYYIRSTLKQHWLCLCFWIDQVERRSKCAAVLGAVAALKRLFRGGALFCSDRTTLWCTYPESHVQCST